MNFNVRVDFEDGYTIVTVDAPNEQAALALARKAILPHSAFNAQIVR